MMRDGHGTEPPFAGSGFKRKVSGVSSSAREIRRIGIEFHLNDRTPHIKRSACFNHVLGLPAGSLPESMIDMKHFRTRARRRGSFGQGKKQHQQGRGIRPTAEAHQQTRTDGNPATQ